jgi:hypothetical protein
MKNKNCVDCGKSEIKERRRCKECAKEYNRRRAYDYYKKNGKWFKWGTCSICKKPMKMWRSAQTRHKKCSIKTDSKKGSNKKLAGNYHSRKLVKSLGLKLPKGWVTHHLDEDTFNNVPSNLWCMSRQAHASLHAFLNLQRSIWLKSQNENSEDCWKPLRAHLTTAWFEKTGANVIKISEIGQSAAEPLLNGEGSEAMHGTSKA